MEIDLLHIALEKFENITQLHFEKAFLNKHSKKLDGSINLTNPQTSFNFEIKPSVQTSNLPNILKLLERFKNPLLISEYISKPAKKQLRASEISYIDTAGNTFLKNENLFVYVETNKTNRVFTKQSNRAFSKTGLKIVFYLLTKNDNLNQSYREIAKQNKVSPDSVSQVFKGLLKDKYIIKVNNKKYDFLNKKKLFEEWVTLFNKILRPKLKQRTFKFLKKTKTFNNIHLSENSVFGGEYAGELLSNYLIAEKAIIYTSKPFIDLIQEHQLIPDKQGNITVTEKFWEIKNNLSHFKNLVHPILVYADLLTDTNTRNIETAQKIYEKHIKDTL